MRGKLGKNEDFFVALWIFQPKTAIFAPGATRFPAFPRCASDGPNLRHLRAVAAASSGSAPFCRRFRSLLLKKFAAPNRIDGDR